MCVPLASADGKAARRHPTRHAGPHQEVHAGRPEAAHRRRQPAAVAIEKAQHARGGCSAREKRAEGDRARPQGAARLPAADAAGRRRVRVLRPLLARPRRSAATTTTSSRCPAAASRSCSATWPARACRPRCSWPSSAPRSRFCLLTEPNLGEGGRPAQRPDASAAGFGDRFVTLAALVLDPVAPPASRW